MIFSPTIMRHEHVTAAIVLRSWPFGESDKIVSFITESHGKVTGIAKGAKRSRRRFVNSLEPFSFITLRFQDRPHSNLAFIAAAELAQTFKGLAASLEKIAFASYMVEITGGLVGEREENPPVFEHLRDGLRQLDQNDVSLRFLTTFELKLLRLAGYQPLLSHCKRCGRQRLQDSAECWHFSCRDGGIFCEVCSRWTPQSVVLANQVLEVLAELQSETIGPQLLLPASVVKEIRAVVQRFIQFRMDREIKSASFLEHFSTS